MNSLAIRHSKNIDKACPSCHGLAKLWNTNGTVNGWHYYIQDYMGNNRMVVNKNGVTEQVTHYYPYGGVIGDISTNESVQKYKFEGKELDRTFGLDNYDIHARQYFAMMPTWDRIDPLAEKYYGISPYAYCGGDPINLGDYNGMWIMGTDGNAATYNKETRQWSDNASEDTKVICIEMMKTAIGSSLVESLQSTSFPISMVLDRENYATDKNGMTLFEKIGSHRYSVVNRADGTKKITESTITIYEKAIDEMLPMINEADRTVFSSETIQGRYRSALGMGNVTKEDMIGGAGVHEAVHVTDPSSNATGEALERKREEQPIIKEIEHLNQLNELK